MRGLRPSLAAVLLAAGLAEGQTPDPVFAAWEWNAPARGPRVSGLGGIFVTTAQSGSAILLSPACLSFQPSREVSASVGAWPQATYTQGLGRWVVGARAGRRMEREIVAPGVDVTPQKTIDFGRVDFSADSLALASSFRHRWGRYERVGVHLGAGLELSKLNVDGTYVVLRPAAREETRIALRAESTQHRFRTTTTASALLEWGHEYSDRVRLGAAVRGVPLRPAYWAPERTVLALRDGAPAVPQKPGRVLFREPLSWSVGLEGTRSLPLPLLGTTDFLLAGQMDWTRYQDVLDSLVRNSPSDGGRFEFQDRGPDWSVALEMRLKDVVSLRGGVRVGHPRQFRAQGAEGAEEDKARLSVGASLRQDVLGQLLRVDLDWFRGFGFGAFSGGASLSF